MGLSGLFQRDVKSSRLSSVWKVKLLGSIYFILLICKLMQVSDVFSPWYLELGRWWSSVICFLFWNLFIISMNFQSCSVINFWDCALLNVSDAVWVFRIWCLGGELQELMKLRLGKWKILYCLFHEGISEDVWLCVLEDKQICMKWQHVWIWRKQLLLYSDFCAELSVAARNFTWQLWDLWQIFFIFCRV